jgi:hypothetical protein
MFLFSIAIGVATGYMLDGWDLIPVRGSMFYCCSQTILAEGPTQPPIQWVPGCSFLGGWGEGKGRQFMEPVVHILLVLRTSFVELCLHSHIHFYSVVHA